MVVTDAEPDRLAPLAPPAPLGLRGVWVVRRAVASIPWRGRGEHAPILDRPLFEAVQAELAVRAVARRCRLRGSPAILSGRLSDALGCIAIDLSPAAARA
jgi:hypothetical protein